MAEPSGLLPGQQEHGEPIAIPSTRFSEGRVAVMVDSSSGVDPGLAGKWGLRVVPLTVTLGDEEFVDLPTCRPPDFDDRLACGEHVKTSAPPPSAWQAAFGRSFAAGATAIVVVSVSSKISSAANHAVAGAIDFGATRVIVIDSAHAGGSQALVARDAARWASTGADSASVAARVHMACTRARMWMEIQTVGSLQRSGRLAAREKLRGVDEGRVLITMEDGVLRPVRIRPPEGSSEPLLQLLAAAGQPQEILVSAGGDARQADELVQSLQRRWPDAQVELTGMSAVVSGHCGPGAIGLATLLTRSEPGPE